MAVRIIEEKWINTGSGLNALRYVKGFCLSTDPMPTDGNLCTGSNLTAVDSGDVYYFTEGNPGSWAVPTPSA